MRRLQPLLLLAAALPAQSYVIPDGSAATAWTAWQDVPTKFAPARSQTTYDAAGLTGLPTGLIRSLAMRRDGYSTAPFAAHAFVFTVHMASLGVCAPMAQNGGSFSANQGSDWTRVVNARSIAFAADPLPATPPAPFTVSIPLDAPFPYVQGNHLQVQYDTATLSLQPEIHEWIVEGRYTGAQKGKSSLFGTACPAGGTFYIWPTGINGWRPLEMAWDSGVAKPSLGFAFLGLGNLSWGGVPLPFALDALGAPGCAIYCDWLLATPGVTDPASPTGTFAFAAVPPHDPVFASQVLYGQILVLDAGFNALGLRLSQGAKMTLGTYSPSWGRHLYSSQNLPITDIPESNDWKVIVLQVGM